MTTWQALQSGRRPMLITNRALLSWALIVAVALLSYFVHVLNEQVRRGESMRVQLRLASRASPPLPSERPLKVADAGPARRSATTSR